MKKKSFFDFFPAPKFLKMPAVGLSLSDDAIRFVEYERTLKGLRIKRFGEKAVPTQVMRSGHIENAQSFIEILKEFKKRHNLSFVRTALPEEKGYLFQTEVPIVSPKEVRESIEFKIEENVPLSLSEVVFDYRVVRAREDKNYLEVVVCVLPVKVATMYSDILKAAELTPLSLGIQSQAISQAVIKEGDERAILVLNMDKTTAGFYIVNEGVVHFSSTITRGSQSLFTAFPEEVRESLKKDEKGKKYLPEAFQPEAAAVFRDTIKKFISYWDTYKGNTEGKTIEKIILCGDSSHNQDFLNYISSGTGVLTDTGNVWTNAFSFDDYIPEIPFEKSLLFAEASGLALPIDE
ncbi:MAG: pilus assembly protein PilM [Patescibacteria group bacterium]|nr:pilus assembly protein PilM [bacterium]MDZ4240993.1 pilus assembly protein PilM [Patescibacteria group bacterium]